MGKKIDTTELSETTPDKIQAVKHIVEVENPIFPTALELKTLYDISPDLCNMVMELTIREQKDRHERYKREDDLEREDMVQGYKLSKFKLFYAFTLITLSMAFSTYLIYNKLRIEGTIFAGATVLAAMMGFLRFKHTGNGKNNQPEEEMKQKGSGKQNK